MNNSEKLILIVDDNLKNLQLTAKILKDEEFLISLAQNGKAAIQQLEKYTPDLILLDIMMPEMDGMEVCRKIKENEKLKEIPVIFLTAKNETSDLVEGFLVGGVDYITKPFKREELLIRVRNHLELAESKKKIIKMNRTRDKLYSIIAHDIRSPLSNISMVVQSIADKIISPDTNDFYEIVEDLSESTTGTLTLLENLLKWTELHGEKIALSPALLRVKPIISDCIKLLKANAEYKTIEVILNIKDEDEAYFDELSIHTIFRNLISNAIKFTPDDGIIEINSTVIGNFLEISVKDNGIGMKEEIQKKIFNRHELHTTLGTNREQGTGFGLFLVNDFIEKNNGKLEINSKLEEGTEVIVKLPVKK